MSDIAIRVENLSKLYHIGARQERHDTLRDALSGLFRSKAQQHRSETDLWALKDVSFEVKRGEVVGIIGRNGAGKSTLLKILSRITEPTGGEARVSGRLRALLEVGTGFHPELTGRENIYLNGSILGMRRQEINRQFDEIVAFSEIERFLDTPVKRFSSGMYVRLAFAVAAHLEPEILLVDEVLAVGDVEFQRKCLGKMEGVAREGRTVLFVSHNMTAVSSICKSAIVFSAGSISYKGAAGLGIRAYLAGTSLNTGKQRLIDQISHLPPDPVMQVTDIQIRQSDETSEQFDVNQAIVISIEYRVLKPVQGLRIGFDLKSREDGGIVFRSFHDDMLPNPGATMPGIYQSTAVVPANLLAAARYEISILAGIHMVRWLVFDQIRYDLDVVNLDGINAKYADQRPGIVMPKIDWDTSDIRITSTADSSQLAIGVNSR